MKSILYVGNKLSKHGLNKTSIETLGELLKIEGYSMFYSSSKKNQYIRFLDMAFFTLFKASKVKFVLIDTYSTSSFWYAYMCSQISRILKVKYIPILRGGDLPSRLQKNPKLSRAVFKNAFQNVAPSNYLKSEFEKHGFQNVIYIPNSIEIAKYHYKKRENIEPKLLWVRAFASIYNPDMAIKVLSKLKEKYPNASLTMVGPDKDGSMTITKTLAEKFNLEVNFTGRLSKEDWWKLAENHDVFINTTHFDNTPVSVMEAMALGLPVVSTNVGGIPFLVENNSTALLVNDNDVDEMVTSIQRLLENQELAASLSENGRKLAETWDWKRVKIQWKNLLN